MKKDIAEKFRAMFSEDGDTLSEGTNVEFTLNWIDTHFVERGVVCIFCSTERKIANDGTKYLCNHFSEPCKECENFITLNK